MDTRLICLSVIEILRNKHPSKIPTHLIYKEINADRRAIQRQIKFLFESGLIQRYDDYKIGLITGGNYEEETRRCDTLFTIA